MLSSNPITNNLIKARELIADEKNWVAFDTRITRDGEFAYCARGAILEIINPTWTHDYFNWATPEFWELDKRLSIAAKELGYIKEADVQQNGWTSGVVYVNNHIGHEATIRMFDRAIEDSMENV